jgi:hypothetical protein
MKSSRIIYLILIFLSFVSCQKEKVEIPSFLIGEWRSVENESQIKLIIKKNGLLIFEKSIERGIKAKVISIKTIDYGSEEFIVYRISLKNAGRIDLRYNFNEGIEYLWFIGDNYLSNDDILYLDHSTRLKRIN